MEKRIRGVWCATLTPLLDGGRIDCPRLVDHVRRLFAAGIDGVAPFGTTGEGQSFSLAERQAGLEALLDGGIDPKRIAPGTGCAAIAEAIALTRHAVERGCAGALVLPPFFFKGIGDDGLYASYARLIDGVADDRFQLYLYHIPQVTGVAIDDAVIERLLKAYPATIAGVKDSAGELAHTLGLLKRFPDLAILVGYEPHLPAALAAGGAGAICGLANLDPQLLRRFHDAKSDTERGVELKRLEALLKLLAPHSLMPAMKAILATLRGDEAWCAVREPLVPLTTAAREVLTEGLIRSGLAEAAEVAAALG